MNNLLDMARGNVPADLVFKNGRVVDVFSGTLVQADVGVGGGTILGYGPYQGKQEVDLGGRILCPGFIDGHVHVESGMVAVGEFARRLVSLGTTTIVTGKILASAIMGLIYGGVYMAGMYVYMGSMTAGIGDVDLSEIGLVLGPVEWIVTMLVMFVSIMCALGLCMILGAFVKSYKGAQTMTLPISVLAMIPMFIFMLSDWNSLGVGMQAIMFAIPFSHPMMVMQNLLFGNVLLVLAGLAYCTLFAIASILITVKLYNSDILLVGLGSTKLGRFLAKFKKAD